MTMFERIASPLASYNQEQMCLLRSFYPDNRAYNFQATIDLEGELDVARLERAVTAVIARHEVLRTAISLEQTGFRARVRDPLPFSVIRHDLSDLAGEDQKRALDAVTARSMDRAFDLESVPVIDIHCVRLSPTRWRLIQVEHHVIHDGWSVGRIWTEIQRAYADPDRAEAGASDLPIQYQHFVHWQRGRMEGEYGREALDFWQGYVAGAAQDISITPGREAGRTLDGHTFELALSPDTFRRVRSAARRLAVSNFVLLFSLFARLVSARTGERDLLIGTAVNARTEPELEPLVGMVVNTIPIRAVVDPEGRIDADVRSVQRSLFRALRYQDVPLSLLTRRLKLRQKPGKNPLFQHCFSFHDSVVPRLRLGGARGNVREEQNQSSKFEVNVVVIPPDGREGIEHARMLWQFSQASCSIDEAKAFADAYMDALGRVLADGAGEAP